MITEATESAHPPIDEHASLAQEPLSNTVDDDTPDEPTRQVDEPVGAGGASIVMILSKGSDQTGNFALLRNFGLDPLQFDSWAAARTDFLNMADICGCVIDGSFVADMTGEEQLTFFAELARYSTFTWMRIDESGLHVGLPDLREAIRKARCLLAPLNAESISVRSGTALKESEIPDLQRAQSILRSHLLVRVQPRQFSAIEGQLLTAAMWKSFEESTYDRAQPRELLEVEFLSGGYSGARTVLVRLDGSPRPEIAKVNARERVVEEIERFYTFIQTWDPELQPRAFFHANAALILFGIIPHEADQTQPAAMLSQCLEDLWNKEVFANNEMAFRANSRQADNLKGAVGSIAEKLFTLNRCSPPPTAFAPQGDPFPTVLANLENRGIRWNLAGNTASAVEKAVAQYSNLQRRAVIHGDLHLGNILVRGDRDPHLIDYANSGPGHPALDLVRLELALYLATFRPFETDETYLQYQRAFSLEGITQTDLEHTFRDAIQCLTNRVCVTGCVAARDFALQAVQAHQGSERDYLATKYLVALQSLVMHGRQTSLTRSVINSLTEEIAGWN